MGGTLRRRGPGNKNIQKLYRKDNKKLTPMKLELIYLYFYLDQFNITILLINTIKMKTIKNLLIFSMVLALFAGCQDELAPLQDVQEVKRQLKIEEVEDRVVESVTGSGHFDRDFQIEVWRTFSLSAQKRESGAVEGTFQINNHGFSDVQGIVLCLTVIDDEAIVITQATASSSPDIIGQLYYARLFDNGQGKHSSPDIISLFHPFSLEEGETIEDYCGAQIQIPTFTVESGNIKVHKSK